MTVTYSLEDVQTEVQANVTTDNDQSLSNVIGLEGGGIALAYVMDDAGGDFIELVVSSGTFTLGTDVQGEPVITELDGGNVAVVWEEGPGGQDAILATIINPVTGSVVLPEGVIITSLGATDIEVTALEGGGFLVAFTAPGGSVLRQFTSTGGFISEIPVEAGATDLAVTQLDGGRIAVTYVDAGDVKARLYEANGTPVAGVGEIVVVLGDATSPQIVALNNGGFAVICDDGSLVDTPGIGMKIYDADGNDVTPGGIIIRIDISDANEEADPEITVLENGFILVSYTNFFGGTDADIRARIYDQDGNQIAITGGSDFAIDEAIDVDESQSSVAGLGSGRFVTIWTDEQGDGDGDRISGRVQELVRTITGDGDDNVLFGDELRDIIHGGGGSDIVVGGGGRDELFGEAGNDFFQVGDGDVQAGQIYDGGDDFDTLNIVGSGASVFDFRTSTLTALERLGFSSAFGGGATVQFNAAQFQFESVFFDAPVTGARVVSIFMDTETTLDLSGVDVLGTVGAGDHFEITGDDDPETITGSEIADTIDGGGGADTLNGGDGNDTLIGGFFSDTIDGGDGDDTIIVREGEFADDVVGGTGVDLYAFEYLSDQVVINLEAGTLQTSLLDAPANTVSGIENVTGGGGDDTITGNGDVNTLDGGGGDDTLAGGLGDDTLIGGTGVDTADFSAATGALVVDLDASGNGTTSAAGIGTDTFTGIENLTGGSGGDSIFANASANTLSGEGGDDFLVGGGGDDTLIGGNDNDTLQGITGKDSVSGGAGNDTLEVGNGQVESGETYDGGADFDILAVFGTGASLFDFRSVALDGLEQLYFVNDLGGGVTAQFNAVQFAQFESVFFEAQVTGARVVSIFMDTETSLDLSEVDILGTVGPGDHFQITGTAGNDTITGSKVADTIDAGGNNDTLKRGLGNDTLDGGAGTGDTADYSDKTTSVEVTLNGAIDATVAVGFVAEDTIRNIENVIGGSSSDTLTGDAQANFIDGGGGIDTLKGGLGNDTLDGRTGGDTADYSDKTTSVVVTLNGITDATVTVGGVPEDTIRGIEHLLGGSNNDQFTGSGGANLLFGAGGNDTLKGGGDIDTLDGGTGTGDTADYSDKTSAVVVALNGATNVTVTVGGANEDFIRNIENVIGGTAGDTLTGDGQANTLNGGGGNDILDGAGGLDTADYSDKTTAVVVVLNGSTNATVTVGGVAEDTIRNIENVIGGTAGDTLTGDGLANTLSGGAGSDTLKGGLGADTLDGGANGDFADYRDKANSVVVTLNGATNATVTVGGVAEDTIRNIESVYGGTAGDILTGDGFGNTLFGNSGNDLLKGGGGADTLDGSAGVDRADYGDKVNSVVVTLNGATNAIVTVGGVAEDTIKNIENLVGGSAGDTLTGDGLANTFRGGGGADLLDGAAGSDTADYAEKATSVAVTLNGATNATVTVGGVAEDTIRNIENVTGGTAGDILTGDGLGNVLFGGSGNDLLKGGGGADTLDGSTGVDRADYSDKAAAVVVTLNGATNAIVTVGGVAEDTIEDIENLVGGSAGDTLTGDGLANTFRGGGADLLNGAAGSDTADYADKATAVVVTLNGATNATVTVGGVAEDTIKNFENVIGGTAGDTLTGDGLANGLSGGAGTDVLKGGLGADTLDGGANGDFADYRDKVNSVDVTLNGANDATVKVGGVAEDTVKNIENVYGGTAGDVLRGDGFANYFYGHLGNDLLSGGGGNDTLVGAQGADTFRFNTALNAATNVDHITDFATEDTIHLDDAVFTTLTAGSLAAGAFHSAAGATSAADANDRIVYNTTTGALYYDSDGVGGVAAVQFADLDNNAALTSADFFVV